MAVLLAASILILLQSSACGAPVTSSESNGKPCSVLHHDAIMCVLDLQYSNELKVVIRRRKLVMDACTNGYPIDCIDDFESKKACVVSSLKIVSSLPQYTEFKNQAQAAAEKCFLNATRVDSLQELTVPYVTALDVTQNGHGDIGSVLGRPECEETETEKACSEQELLKLYKNDTDFSNAVKVLMEKKTACMQRIPTHCRVDSVEWSQCYTNAYGNLSVLAMVEAHSCLHRKNVNTTRTSLRTTSIETAATTSPLESAHLNTTSSAETSTAVEATNVTMPNKTVSTPPPGLSLLPESSTTLIFLNETANSSLPRTEPTPRTLPRTESITTETVASDARNASTQEHAAHAQSSFTSQALVTPKIEEGEKVLPTPIVPAGQV